MMRRALLRRAAAVVFGLLALVVTRTAGAVVETRPLDGVDELVLEVVGEITVRQGDRDALTIDADPAVLRLIDTEVRGRRLHIGYRSGRAEPKQPTRLTLVLRELRSLESRVPVDIQAGPLNGTTLAVTLSVGGSIRIARLTARTFALKLGGAGHASVGGGEVTAQMIAITGAGSYAAPRLDCRDAEVRIRGSGDVRLAAAKTLAIRVAGMGEVHYRGDPAVTKSVQGLARIERE